MTRYYSVVKFLIKAYLILQGPMMGAFVAVLSADKVIDIDRSGGQT